MGLLEEVAITVVAMPFIVSIVFIIIVVQFIYYLARFV